MQFSSGVKKSSAVNGEGDEKRERKEEETKD